MRTIIALPVLNEEQVLRPTVESVLRAAASGLSGQETIVVIADNGSTDRTEAIGRELASAHPEVRYLRLDKRGKGLAIRSAWASEGGDVYAFMDADLATDLAALPELVRLAAEGGGLAIGNRFHRESSVRRSLFRGFLSGCYRAFIRGLLGTRAGDLPCGFKAASAEVVRRVLPEVRDNGWFFDTELVVRAERAGFAVKDLPVVWRDDRTPGRRSRVAVLSLVIEYLRRSWRLRLELDAERPAAPLTLGGFFRSIGRREWAGVTALAAAAMIVTSLPPLYALYIGQQRGQVWTGLQFLSPGDLNVYLSYIEQVRQGRWLFVNLYSTERLVPVLNVLWLAVGLLGRALHLAPLAAYHLVRVLLIPLFAFSAYSLTAWFVRPVRRRLAAFALFFFGSGLGFYFVPLFRNTISTMYRYEWPIDLWVAESNAFLTSLYSPHFIASFALFLSAFFLLFFSFSSDRKLHALFAGLAALALFEFHPFHAPTLYAVPLVWLAWRAFRHGPDLKKWLNYAIFCAVSAPAVVYQFFLTHYGPGAKQMVSANLTITPSIWHVLIGFGLVSLLWPLGYWLARREEGDADGRWDLLLAWVVTQLLLVYGPITFQRRLLEGLEFPLVILSVPALAAAVAWIRSKVQAVEYVVAIAAAASVLIFLPTTVFDLGRAFSAYYYDNPPIFYMSRDQAAALDWLRRSTPADAVVLGSIDSGNVIPGWSGRRVYAGHWVNTLDLQRKFGEVADFFGGQMPDSQRLDFVHSQGIDYVYCGAPEKLLGGCPTDASAFAPVFRSGDIVILQPRSVR